MIEEYKEKSIEEIIDYLESEEIGHIECDYEKVSLLFDCIKEKSKEIERLHSIIKEVRELLNQEWYSVLRKETITKVREILDKEEQWNNHIIGTTQ